MTPPPKHTQPTDRFPGLCSGGHVGCQCRTKPGSGITNPSRRRRHGHPGVSGWRAAVAQQPLGCLTVGFACMCVHKVCRRCCPHCHRKVEKFAYWQLTWRRAPHLSPCTPQLRRLLHAARGPASPAGARCAGCGVCSDAARAGAAAAAAEQPRVQRRRRGGGHQAAAGGAGVSAAQAAARAALYYFCETVKL